MTPCGTQHKLDNPVWFALQEKHSAFATGNELIKRYLPSIAPFLDFSPLHPDALKQLASCIEPAASFFMFREKAGLPDGFKIVNSLTCVQLVTANPVAVSFENHIEPLGEANTSEMFELVSLVQPGYYELNTRLMGNYAGIRINGQLVALAGERMRMDNFTEISAVVTHPHFTGRRYAQQLIAYITNQNIAAGNTVFLHASATNKRAVGIYEHLGFSLRRLINLHKIQRIW